MNILKNGHTVQLYVMCYGPWVWRSDVGTTHSVLPGSWEKGVPLAVFDEVFFFVRVSYCFLAGYRNSRMLGKIPEDLLSYLQNEPVTQNEHKYGLLVDVSSHTFSSDLLKTMSSKTEVIPLSHLTYPLTACWSLCWCRWCWLSSGWSSRHWSPQSQASNTWAQL